MLNDVEDFLNRLYEHTSIRYLRSDVSSYSDDISKYGHFKSLAVSTLQLYIGGNFDASSDKSDLKKIEENFHMLIKDFYLREENIGDYDYSFPKVTGDLFVREDFNRVPGMYGGFFYFLKLEGGKPVLYVNASSRMDLDELIIIDEICYTWIGDGEYWEKISESDIMRNGP